MSVSLETLRDSLPELALVRNDDLRARVEEAWLMAWRESKIASLDHAPLLAGGLAEKVGLEHIRQTARLALAIVEQQAVSGYPAPDRDIAVAGALLHDIGKLHPHEPDKPIVRHVFWAAHIGFACGLPAEVVHIMVAHSFEGDLGERSAECMAVRYADFLSADMLFRRELGISGNAYLKKHGFPPK